MFCLPALDVAACALFAQRVVWEVVQGCVVLLEWKVALSVTAVCDLFVWLTITLPGCCCRRLANEAPHPSCLLNRIGLYWIQPIRIGSKIRSPLPCLSFPSSRPRSRRSGIAWRPPALSTRTWPPFPGLRLRLRLRQPRGLRVRQGGNASRRHRLR